MEKELSSLPHPHSPDRNPRLSPFPPPSPSHPRCRHPLALGRDAGEGSKTNKTAPGKLQVGRLGGGREQENCKGGRRNPRRDEVTPHAPPQAGRAIYHLLARAPLASLGGQPGVLQARTLQSELEDFYPWLPTPPKHRKVLARAAESH